MMLNFSCEDRTHSLNQTQSVLKQKKSKQEGEKMEIKSVQEDSIHRLSSLARRMEKDS